MYVFLCLCQCCCLCCCLWLLLLFVVATLQCQVLRSQERVSGRKEHSRKPVSRISFPLFLNFNVFDSVSIFRKTKIEETCKVVKKKEEFLWLIDRLSKTFLSLIQLLINILIKFGPKSLIVAQNDLPSKHLKRICQKWESSYSSSALSC